MSNAYLVQLRGPDLKLIGEIDDWWSLTVTLRFNDVSAWTLDLPPDTPLRQFIQGGSCGVVISRNGTVLVAGPLLTIQRQQDPTQTVLHLEGLSDEYWLRCKLVYPDPTTEPAWGTDYDVRTGTAETIWKQLVDLNAGPGALAQRRIGALTVEADAAQGPTLTTRGRLQTVLELLQSSANVIAGMGSAELGFRVAWTPGALTFQVYSPADHSGNVVFSLDSGDVDSLTYRLDAPTATFVIAGGSGTGATRGIASTGSSSSTQTVKRPILISTAAVEEAASPALAQWGRIEKFTDQRSASSQSELIEAINETLAVYSQREQITFIPDDVLGFTYGVDYVLGDLVAAVMDGLEIVQRVREVRFSASASSTSQSGTAATSSSAALGNDTVRPVLSAPTQPGMPSLASDPSGIIGGNLVGVRRISNLERV